MSSLKTYTYTVLRYVHDITTGEFVNVGVALYCREAKFIEAKVRTTYGRITKVFPGTNGEYVKQMLGHIGRSFETFSNQEQGIFPADSGSVLDFAHRAFPPDDSSLQWSPIGSGKTSLPGKTLEQLFQRFVMQHEEKHGHSRSNEEVWGVFSRELSSRRVLDRLKEKRIVGQLDEVEFKHSWKNGIWHCLEPLSFDLVEPESIKDKARKFFGQMELVRDTNERFKLYLLVGEPSRSEVEPAYKSALKMLDKISIEHEIYTESQAAEVSAKIEAQMAAQGHD
jgi:Protein of unknown function (DUF3037)